MDRRTGSALLIAVSVVLLTAQTCGPPHTTPPPPSSSTTTSELSTSTTDVTAPADADDILFILLDDVSIDSPTYYMPALQQLVQGEHWYRFTQAVSPATLCGPSRASQLTGQTPNHHGYTCHLSGVMCPSWSAMKDRTITVSLDDIGYHVLWSGKQLNSAYQCPGDLKSDGYPNPPGVDDARILGPGDDKMLYNSYFLVENGTRVCYNANANAAASCENKGPEFYGTYRTADFVEQCIATCPSSQPLALFWNPMASHSPGEPPPDYDPSKVLPGLVEKQPPLREGCPDTPDPDISDKPFLLQSQTSCSGNNWNRSRWQSSLQGVDNRLSPMISAFLARSPERPKKIIITSDHGHELGNHRHIAKEVPYEMTVRVPLFIYDSESTGGTIETLVNTLSLNPTIHEWAGSTPLLSPDAGSLVPLYRGQSASWPDHAYISHLLVSNSIHDIRPWHAIRQDCSLRRDQDGDGNDDCFKLVVYPASSPRLPDGSTVALGVEWELYDLVEDPWELTQLLPNDETGYPGQPGWDHDTPIAADLRSQLQAHIAAGA